MTRALLFRVDNAIQPINHYLAVKCQQNVLRYPLDSDLSKKKKSAIDPSDTPPPLLCFFFMIATLFVVIKWN